MSMANPYLLWVGTVGSWTLRISASPSAVR